MAIDPGYPIHSGRLVGSTIINGVRVQEVVNRPGPGITRSHGNEEDIATTAADQVYALVGVRAKPSELALVISLSIASVTVTTNNDKFEWRLYQNPTIDGTFTYSDLPNSRAQVATATSANIITDGIILPRAFGESGISVQAQFTNELEIGPAEVELVLAVNTLTNNAAFRGALSWRELQ